MSKNRLRRILLLAQGAIVFFLALLFAAGVFYDQVLNKIEANLAAHPSSEFDRKLATKIGRPFSAEDHRKLVEIVTAGDEGVAGVTEASHNLAKIALNVSGLAIFLALSSIFLLVRNLRGAGEAFSAKAEPSGPKDD